MSDHSNFSFLGQHSDTLLGTGMAAERYCVEDPSTCIFKLRLLIEQLAQYTAIYTGHASQRAVQLFDLINTLDNAGVLSRELAGMFHSVRLIGNKAVHHGEGSQREALTALRTCWEIAVWFHRAFKDKHFDPPAFSPPEVTRGASQELLKELESLKQRHAQSLSQVRAAMLEAEQEAALRAQVEAHAAALAQEAAQLRALSEQEREALRADADAAAQRAAALEAQLAALEQALSAEQIKDNLDAAQRAAGRVQLDEAQTRQLIDAQLIAAGWEADSVELTWRAGVRPEPKRCKAIAEWPTLDNGRADYVLFIGMTPVAILEAKPWRASLASALEQATRYARAGLVDVSHDQLAHGAPWVEVELGEQALVPFVLASNARPFVAQEPDLSGVLSRDLRAGRPQRTLGGLPSPHGLHSQLAQDHVAVAEALDEVETLDALAATVGLRDYQRAAIEAVQTLIRRGSSQRALIAMATGTGKTRMAIGLIARLLFTKAARRILFLVDRRALGDQAHNAFKETRVHMGQPLTDIYAVYGLGERPALDPARFPIGPLEPFVQIATVQSIVGEVSQQPPALPADLYDCIIVDECHRGYALDKEMSAVELEWRDEQDYRSRYRAALDYFDALKIGLTATPALHTLEIFGLPIATYTYQQAVAEGWLTDHAPPLRLYTRLGLEGVRLEAGQAVEFFDPESGLLVEDVIEDEVTFRLEDFNRRVEVEGFNRAICEALVERIDPRAPGKTLIFCVDDAHADKIVRLLRELYCARDEALPPEAIQKLTGKTHQIEQALRRYKNERYPAIAVTVDLLTTGVDVPAICNLVFLRAVRSRILFEQMLGRATRLCPDIGKERFEIYDAVGIYDALEPMSQMRPVCASVTLGTEQLVADVRQRVPDPVAAQSLMGQLIGRLQSRAQALDEEASVAFEVEAGAAAPTLLRSMRRWSPAEVADWLDDAPQLVPLLERLAEESRARRAGRPISRAQDTLLAVERQGGLDAKYLEAFMTYIQNRDNRAEAITLLATRPHELTGRDLKALRAELSAQGFDEQRLRIAYHDAGHADVAASILGYIRQAALGDPLVAWEARVRAALERLLAQRAWSEGQRRWLERFALHLIKNQVLDDEALDSGEFRQQGGGKLRIAAREFDGELDPVLDTLRRLVWEADAS